MAEIVRNLIEKNKIVRRLISLVLSFCVLLAILIVYLHSTLGWFSSNRNVVGNGMSVNVDYDDFTVSATYYQYNPRTSSVDASDDLSDISFNPYDLVFRARNRYTPIVVAVKMSGSDLPENGTVTVSLHRDTSKPKYDQVNLKMSEFFTDIMRVTPYVGASYYSSDAGVLYGKIDTTEHYNLVRSFTGNTSSPSPDSKVFTSVSTDGDNITNVEKDDYIEFEIGYTSSDFVSIEGANTLIVYLYFTYDEGYNTETIENVTTTRYDGLLGIYQRTSGSLGISGGEITEAQVEFGNDLLNIRASHD